MKKPLMAVGASFVFVYAFHFFVHHILLLETYKATSHLWRPASEMSTYAPWYTLCQLFFSMAMVMHMTKTRERKAICFGTSVGLILAMTSLMTYSYMPIPLMLAGAWAITSLFTCIGVALIADKILDKYSKFD